MLALLIILYSDALESYDDFDRYNKLIQEICVQTESHRDHYR